MKKNEIAILLLIVGVTVGITYVIVNQLVSGYVLKSAEVERVSPISAELQQPSPTIFNRDAINPTVPVEIGDGSGPAPF